MLHEQWRKRGILHESDDTLCSYVENYASYPAPYPVLRGALRAKNQLQPSDTKRDLVLLYHRKR